MGGFGLPIEFKMIALENQGSHNAVPAYNDLRGGGSFVAEAGRRVQIGMRDPIQVEFDEVVPAGKQWDVYVNITIVETDA